VLTSGGEDIPAIENPDLEPMIPGEHLRRDVFPQLDMTMVEIAKALGVSRQTLHSVLRGKTPISVEMALRLGKFLGTGPRIWLALQARRDAWETRQRIASELEHIQPAF
jgi:antitoxin HigA-1